ATRDMYPLSLHDALPISGRPIVVQGDGCRAAAGEPQVDFTDVSSRGGDRSDVIGELLHEPDRMVSRVGNGLARAAVRGDRLDRRSEEHTSELQSPCNLVC